MSAQTLETYVSESAGGILDACTRCGKCVEVCPVTSFAGLDGANPTEVVGGVLASLREERPMQGNAAAWANQCDGCGICIPACPESVNPRNMLMLAQTVGAAEAGKTPQLFRKMARAIRVMAAMQLAPADLATLMRPKAARPADVIFYVGCNAVRTPHLLFNAMYVLDALEVDYEVLGGPSSCCGIIQSKWEGDMGAAERVTDGTLTRFGDFQPERVLSWCPSCVLHLDETIGGFRDTSYGFDHVTQYLVEQAGQLTHRFTNPVPMRVVVHVHDGMPEFGANVEALLRRIPGLEIVDVVSENGYTCGGSGADRSPGLKAERRKATLAAMAEEGVDALVSLYHGCHAQLSKEAEVHGFKTVNWTDLLVLALGGEPRQDLLEGWRASGDWLGLVQESQPTLAANKLDIDPDVLLAQIPEIMTQAEFRGGLEAFAAPDRGAD